MPQVKCDYLNDYGVTLYVGGCGESGRWFRRKAHAHNDRKSPLLGTICVLSERRLYNPDGSPSNLLKHELAHILCVNHGHDQLWADVLRSLGGKIDRSYYSHVK